MNKQELLVPPTSADLKNVCQKLEELQSRYDILQHFLVHSQRIVLQMAEEIQRERGGEEAPEDEHKKLYVGKTKT